MNLEKAFDIVTKIKVDLIENNLKPFTELLDEATTLSFAINSKEKEICNFKDSFDRKQQSLDENIAETNEVLQKLSEKLRAKREQVKNQQNILEKLKVDQRDKLKEITNVNKKCDIYEQKLEGLQELRDTVKTYKLITGAHFDFSNKAFTDGYIKQEESLQCEVFSFNNSLVSEEDRKKELWALIEKVAKQ